MPISSLKLVGRPFQVTYQGSSVIFKLINEWPKHIPAPREEPTFLVFALQKEWVKIAEAIKAEDDKLIVEAIIMEGAADPLIEYYVSSESSHTIIPVCAASLTTKKHQIAERAKGERKISWLAFVMFVFCVVCILIINSSNYEYIFYGKPSSLFLILFFLIIAFSVILIVLYTHNYFSERMNMYNNMAGFVMILIPLLLMFAGGTYYIAYQSIISVNAKTFDVNGVPYLLDIDLEGPQSVRSGTSAKVELSVALIPTTPISMTNAVTEQYSASARI